MKKILKGLALVLVVVVLAGLAMTAYRLYNQTMEQTQALDALTQENEQLRTQLQQMQQELDRVLTTSSLESWDLYALAWEGNTGADVFFTAEPTKYFPELEATLLVTLDEQQVASVPCNWDGRYFKASVGLEAADGYTYYCLLSGGSESQQLILMGPDTEKAGVPVYLQSSLGSYCNLVIHDWSEKNGTSLILSGAYAQVQMPRIQAQELTFASQELVLRLNGETFAKVPISMAPSEVEGSYEITLTDLHLPLPKLNWRDSLELYLEVTFSDGRYLQGFGISWHLENGRLAATVG